MKTPRILCAGLVAGITAIGVALGYQALASSSSPAYSSSPAAPPARGVAGGAVPGGTTVFDDDIPGVAKLDPALLGALRRAATDASGVEFVVDSGWRSAAYQQRLLDEAVSKYGSRQEAARWVADPDRSAHVSGDAVDLGPAAAAWLSQHGAAYGLCQIYANEPWHYELRRDPCPPMYSDPTQDPKMSRSFDRLRSASEGPRRARPMTPGHT